MIAPIKTHDARRRVLFLIPTLNGGGAERVMTTLLKHLDRRKFRLSLGVLDTSGAAFLNQIPDDVELIDLKCRRVRYALLKIIALIWCRQPDVIFSTLDHLNLALAMIRTFLPNKVKFLARETNILSHTYQKYRWPKLWEKLTFLYYPHIDFLVCQSKNMQQDIVDNFSFPQEKTIVIHNPVDMDFILSMASTTHKLDNKDQDTTYLVAAGRLQPQKGFDLLIEAMALLHNQLVHLDILGEGPLLNDLKQLAHSKGVDKQIRFVGFQDNPYAWFARADGFVLSSRYEGLPNVVLEALACGTPVITTPAPGGVREILDSIPECVVAKALSAEAIAEAITEWIARPKKRLSDTVITPYKLKRIVSQYEALLLSN